MSAREPVTWPEAATRTRRPPMSESYDCPICGKTHPIAYTGASDEALAWLRERAAREAPNA